MRPIANIVFVKSRDDAVAIVGDVAIEPFLRRSEPVGAFREGVFVASQFVANVEIAVFQRLFVDASRNPVIVHPECAEHDSPIVSAQKVVERTDSLGLQFDEHRIDELHDVVIFELRQQSDEPQQQPDAADFRRFSRKVDVTRIILPKIAVGSHCHLVSERPQPFRERPMHVAVFAE